MGNDTSKPADSGHTPSFAKEAAEHVVIHAVAHEVAGAAGGLFAGLFGFTYCGGDDFALMKEAEEKAKKESGVEPPKPAPPQQVMYAAPYPKK